MTLSDVEIAQAHALEPITTIAGRAGLPNLDQVLIPYGHDKAKIDATALHNRPANGSVVLVTGMSPTPAGEGKSTVLIGLVDALRLRNHNAIAALREPSQGPVMGIKGGAAGGGYSQVVPMEDINLHFTGDFHAIAAANNTLAALVDNHIHQSNSLGIDPRRVTWQRCLDVNDRALRRIVTGLGGKAHGVPAESGFTITAASEIMAILCLATSLEDLKERCAAITVGFTYDGQPVTAGQLDAAGAITALLKDALQPNLAQTLGGAPAIIHGGPFANIAHGCNSIMATATAARLADIVVTEAGFGADLGAEKFLDIKARCAGLNVSTAVVVATIRSLKYNAGVPREQLQKGDVEKLKEGTCNLQRHIENLRMWKVTPIVALNLFSSDTEEEIEFMRHWAQQQGVALEPVTVWADGGQGAVDLADTVVESLGQGASQPLYDPADGVEHSIETIARTIYRAKQVEYSPQAKKDLALLKQHGWNTLPVCISKTQYSFSDDPTALGAPSNHVLHVRELQPRTGAGFVVVLTGDVMTMPGLPKNPAANSITVDAYGTISGLF